MRSILVVIDGAKALAKSVRDVAEMPKLVAALREHDAGLDGGLASQKKAA